MFSLVCINAGSKTFDVPTGANSSPNAVGIVDTSTDASTYANAAGAANSNGFSVDADALTGANSSSDAVGVDNTNGIFNDGSTSANAVGADVVVLMGASTSSDAAVVDNTNGIFNDGRLPTPLVLTSMS